MYIKIFLLDGEPTGTKIIELSGWIGKAYLIPRNRIGEVVKREDLKSQCIYMLISSNISRDDMQVYIGETESFNQRIYEHTRDPKKEFWNYVLCFVAERSYLNKARIRYLEAKLISDLISAKRAICENSTNPAEQKLEESDVVAMQEFAKNIKLVTSTLGYTFFHKLVASTSHKDNNTASNQTADDEIFYIKSKGIEARGMMTDEGFLLLAGSKLVYTGTPTFGQKYIQARKNMLDKGEIININNKYYELEKDKLCFSPSFASNIILANSSNGWLEWKTKDGRTLDELKRKY